MINYFESTLQICAISSSDKGFNITRNTGVKLILIYREALTISMDTSLTSKRVIRELYQLIAWRGQQKKIRVDNGPKFVAEALDQWASNRNIDIKFIEKGKPHQNGFMERFNRSFREEVLDAYVFTR